MAALCGKNKWMLIARGEKLKEVVDRSVSDLP